MSSRKNVLRMPSSSSVGQNSSGGRITFGNMFEALTTNDTRSDWSESVDDEHHANARVGSPESALSPSLPLSALAKPYDPMTSISEDQDNKQVMAMAAASEIMKESKVDEDMWNSAISKIGPVPETLAPFVFKGKEKKIVAASQEEKGESEDDEVTPRRIERQYEMDSDLDDDDSPYDHNDSFDTSDKKDGKAAGSKTEGAKGDNDIGLLHAIIGHEKARSDPGASPSMEGLPPAVAFYIKKLEFQVKALTVRLDSAISDQTKAIKDLTRKIEGMQVNRAGVVRVPDIGRKMYSVPGSSVPLLDQDPIVRTPPKFLGKLVPRRGF